MEVIPAIDVLDGSAVRLVRGEYGDVTVYAPDPIAVALGWVAEGASLVHVVDLGAARGDARDGTLLAGLASAGVAFQIGGGVRSVEDATDALAHGARRVVLGSAVVSTPTVAAAIIDEVGTDAVVAALDVRNGRARGSGWRDEGVDLAEAVRTVVGLGIASALVTGIERDGTLGGPDIALLAEVRRHAPALDLIASGGVGSLDDVATLARLDEGPSAVIIGKALYERRFPLGSAIAVARGGGARSASDPDA